MSNNAEFKSKIGVIAATVGSAVGLGNIWRFPAETQANGGAAFLIIYVACVLLLGIPVMLGEFSIGRYGGSDPMTNYQKISPGTKWWMTGLTCILASFMILCFYTVVAGWTFEYMWESLTGALYQPIAGIEPGSAAMFSEKMGEYISGTTGPVVFTMVLIAILIIVLMGGVNKGIERVSNIMMPLLFVILILFCCVSLALPDAGKGVSYLLNPDFSKVTGSTIVSALGQTFFSMSLGMGALMTYAAYYPKNTKLGQTATIVTFTNTGVAVMMGLIIFPAIMSFGLEGGEYAGTALVFVTMPQIFSQMAGTQIWSILFFVLLFFAALTSVISVAEVAVRMMQDRWKLKRLRAVLYVTVPLVVLCPLCALSQGPLNDVQIFGLNIFDLFDTIASEILLPLGALFMCIYIGKAAPKNMMRDELTNYGTIRYRFVGIISFILKWIAPPLIGVILVSQFV